MEYTEEFLRKGHKKEDLIKIILGMQAGHKEDREMLVSQVDCQQKYIKELQSDLKNRDSEYRRWKEFHGDFVKRMIREYMDVFKDDIAEAAADHVAKNLSLDDKTVADYYSSGTDIRLTYKDEIIGSAYVQS